MIVTIYAAFVFVVAVGCAKDGRTYRAGEMLDVVFAVEGCDVGAAEGLAALETQQVQTAEIIGLA
jgi:hypothetical protein